MMPRTVPIGGEMFTKAIADAMGTSMAEAEELKTEKADVTSVSMSPGMGGGAAFTPYNPFAEPSEGDTTAAEVADAGGDATVSDQAAIAPAGPGGAEVGQHLSGVLDEFVAELRRSIDYYRSRGGDVSVIVLCGGGSKLKGLPEFVSSAIGTKCDSFDPMRRLNVNVRKVSPDYVEAHKEEFAVAVGNGLHVVF